MEDLFFDGSILALGVGAAKAVDIYSGGYFETSKYIRQKRKLNEGEYSEDEVENLKVMLEDRRENMTHYWLNKQRKRGTLDGKLRACREYLEEEHKE
jgi:hypothetical protein